MNKKMILLTERRERLIAQAAAQRQALAHDIEPWRTPLALADKGINALRFVSRHPKSIVGVIALIAILQPRSAGKWLGRGWVTWQLMHKLRSRSDVPVISPKTTPPIRTVAH